MHFGQYVFTQLTSFLPKRYFERLVAKSTDRTKNWTPSCWSHLLVLMFGQLLGCKGLKELTDITTAHGKKAFHLGFGKGESSNAVRIQIHVAIITYCLIGIIEHDLKLGRPIIQVMRILGSSLLTKDDISELFNPSEDGEDTPDGQLEFDLDFD